MKKTPPSINKNFDIDEAINEVVTRFRQMFKTEKGYCAFNSIYKPTKTHCNIEYTTFDVAPLEYVVCGPEPFKLRIND